MEGLSTETLQLIQDTAVEASEAEGKLAIVRPPAEPDYIYLTVKPDGTFEKHTAAAAVRNHRLITLDQVENFVKEKGGPSTVVWYDRTGIVIVLDDETRRDIATLALTLTPTMLLLAKLERDRMEFDQREFRKLLKVDLADCQRDARLFNWVSDLKFANMTGGVGQFSNNRESFGNDIEAQAVSGAGGDCPDDLILDVRTFDDPSLLERQGIKCVFDFTPQDRKFRLIPIPLALHDAIELEVTFIGERLAEKIDCSCFRGKFSVPKA